MDDTLTLPVTYNGDEFEFPIKLVPLGYTYRFLIIIDGIEVTFERDDQAEFRALIPQSDIETKKSIERELLAAIIRSLEAIS